jgi:hypothetical protein
VAVVHVRDRRRRRLDERWTPVYERGPVRRLLGRVASVMGRVLGLLGGL